MSGPSGWIGVDFDGTLAQYGGWVNAEHCGEPIPAMVERVIAWRAKGMEVRIFTARIWPLNRVFMPDDALPPRQARWPLNLQEDGKYVTGREHAASLAVEALRQWCRQHIGGVLPITNVKDYGMIELWDDRAVQVRPNTGERVG